MNWEAVGAIAEILGALTVVATLAYLAQQVRLSNRIAIASSEIELRNNFSPTNEAMYGNIEIAQLLTRARNPAAEFDDIEQLRLTAFLRQLFNNWLAIQTAYENGLTSKATYEGIFDDVKNTMKGVPGINFVFRQLVDDYPALAGTKLVAFINESLE